MEDKNKSEEEKKIDNQVKRMKLELESGAKFFQSDNHEIPPDLEASFLDHIISFEKAAKNSEVKTIGEILGDPVFISEKELTNEQVHDKLNQFFQLLEEHNMALDFIYKTPDREIYSFISLEFLAYENEMVTLPGMISHYVYEEFIPNDEGDLKSFAEDIIGSLFNKTFNIMIDLLAEDIYLDNFLIDQDEYIERLIGRFCDASFSLSSFCITNFKIEKQEGKAFVEGEIEFSKSMFEGAPEKISDKFEIEFIKRDTIWGAMRISIPSLSL